MPSVRSLLAVAAMAVLAMPLAGQERAVVFQVTGGGYSHLAKLNNTGPDAHFKTGYTLGAAMGVDINKYFGVRGDFTLSRSEGKGAVSFQNELVNRYFVGGHLEFKYPFRRVTPYAYGGAGAMIVDQQGIEVEEDFEHFTRAAGIFGAGLNFDIPNAPIDFVAEGRASTYKWVAAPFSRTQWDVGYTVGFAYRFGF